jgi:hypothetical protein
MIKKIKSFLANIFCKNKIKKIDDYISKNSILSINVSGLTERNKELNNELQICKSQLNEANKNKTDHSECNETQNKLEKQMQRLQNTLNLKDDEIVALNNKLNTYTMDEEKLLEKLQANVYLYKTNDIKLPAGDKIDLTSLITRMNDYDANALTYVDNYYFSIEKETVAELLKLNTAIDKSKYITETHDCDDFAFALKGMFSQQALSKYAFGWARSSNHAFNFFLDSEGKVWIVEPQNSMIMDYDTVIESQLDSNGEEQGLDYKITKYLI